MQPGGRGFRRFNPKIQAFKHVLDLIWSMKGAEGARQFNSFSDFWSLAIYCSYSHGFKNVQNEIEMTLKLLFLLQNHQNWPAAGGSAPPPLVPSLWYDWVASVWSARGLN